MKHTLESIKSIIKKLLNKQKKPQNLAEKNSRQKKILRSLKVCYLFFEARINKNHSPTSLVSIFASPPSLCLLEDTEGASSFLGPLDNMAVCTFFSLTTSPARAESFSSNPCIRELVSRSRDSILTWKLDEASIFSFKVGTNFSSSFTRFSKSLFFSNDSSMLASSTATRWYRFECCWLLCKIYKRSNIVYKIIKKSNAWISASLIKQAFQIVKSVYTAMHTAYFLFNYPGQFQVIQWIFPHLWGKLMWFH